MHVYLTLSRYIVPQSDRTRVSLNVKGVVHTCDMLVQKSVICMSSALHAYNYVEIKTTILCVCCHCFFLHLTAVHESGVHLAVVAEWLRR